MHCPICNLSLVLDVNPDAHVNACLDANLNCGEIFDLSSSSSDSSGSSGFEAAAAEEISVIDVSLTPSNVDSDAVPRHSERESSSDLLVVSDEKDVMEMKQVKKAATTRQWQNFFRSDSVTVGYSFEASSSSTTAKATTNTTIRANTNTEKSRVDVPFYKKILGTSFAVDCFAVGAVPGITAYFLTHFHSDHYMGLTSRWQWGKVYCSPTTAQLVRLQLRVGEEFIETIPIGQPVDLQGVRVTFWDANHCPGAVLIEFKTPNLLMLHTGDFRAHESQVEVIKSFHGNSMPIYDLLYLDTTYCKPSHTFPSQKSVIEQVTFLCKQLTASSDNNYNSSNGEQRKEKKRKFVFLFGTYLIGKERVFISVASALQSSIYADSAKQKILRCLESEFPHLKSTLTSKKSLASVHVVKMMDLNLDSLQKYRESLLVGSADSDSNIQDDRTTIVAFKPTGWAFTQYKDRPKPTWFTDYELHLPDVSCTAASFDGSIAVLSVPYSEHSSYADLEYFCKNIKWKRIIPTVNCESVASRKAMDKHFLRWKSESRVDSG